MATNEYYLKNIQPMIEQIKNRNMKILFDWMEEHKTKYYKIGWAYLRNPQDVEDVLQNTILKVYDKIDQLKTDHFFEAWVTSIYINECRRVYRQRQRLTYIHTEQIHHTDDESDRLHIWEGLEKIDEIYKEVLILKYIIGHTQDEIAQMLELPVGTVKTRIFRGLRLMRAEMEKGDEIDEL